MNKSASNQAPSAGIRFYPYAAQRFISSFMLIGFLLSLWMVQYCSSTMNKALLIVTAVFCLLFALIGVARIPVLVEIDEQGISVSNVWTKETFHAHWQSYCYVYYLGDSKGNTYMLFVRNMIPPKTQKQTLSEFHSIRGLRPILSIDGNVCILANSHLQAIELMLNGKVKRLPFPGNK